MAILTNYMDIYIERENEKVGEKKIVCVCSFDASIVLKSLISDCAGHFSKWCDIY